MSRESNTAAHKGKTARDRKGMPAFHGNKGQANRKRGAKLESRLKDWTETINRLEKMAGNVAPSNGWPTAYHRPGSYQ